MINAYAVLNDRIAGELTHPTYTYGKNGYVFFHMPNNIEYDDFHKTFAEMVWKIQTYCEERGTKFYFIFDPEKISVYRRYLPDGVNYDDQWVDQMMEYMDEMGVHYVNNAELLTEKSYEEQVFNQKYDAGHWNDLGCFYGTNALLERIHEDIPEVQPLTTDMFDISTETVTSLPNSEFKIEEDIPVFTLKTAWEDVTDDWKKEIDINENFKHFHYYINQAEDAKILPKTLIFQGSYYNRAPQFLVPATSEDIGIHNYQNAINFDYYYNLFQPDVVILDAAEYVFGDQYFELAGMKEMDLNPAVFEYNISVAEQMDQLERETLYVPISANVSIMAGKKIDQLSVDIKVSDVQYAYIISDKQIIDLREDQNGLYCASVVHDLITEESEVIVYIQETNGDKVYMPADVKKIIFFSDDLRTSSGVNIEDDTIFFTTEHRQNSFNQIGVQLYDETNNEYLTTFYSAYSEGRVEETYIHDMESGWYIIRLKVNSNLQDEYVDAMAYLIEGEEYHYSFNIDELSDKTVKISEYQLYGHSGQSGAFEENR